MTEDTVIPSYKGAGMGRIITVASGKGGTAKSSTTMIVSGTLAAMGYRVAVIDGPVANSGVDRTMGGADQQFHALFVAGRPKQSDSNRFCSHTVQAPAKPNPFLSH